MLDLFIAFLQGELGSLASIMAMDTWMYINIDVNMSKSVLS